MIPKKVWSSFFVVLAIYANEASTMCSTLTLSCLGKSVLRSACRGVHKQLLQNSLRSVGCSNESNNSYDSVSIIFLRSMGSGSPQKAT